ncbi:MAG: 4Fe-4S dicluster domain-containing protein, partial [Planctomycetota bacterium]
RVMLKSFMVGCTALALGVAGCERKPKRKIVSRVSGPEYHKPGKPLYYSSTWTEGPYPYGLMIKTVDGRPIKIEGNPDHPINQGRSSAAMQASLLSLYDPDRLRNPLKGNRELTWEEADKEIIEALKNASSVGLITRSNLGPSERVLVDKFLAVCKNAKHFVHETVHDGPRRSAWKKIYGSDGEILPRFDRAKIIVSLDSDFLGTDGAVLENIRTFVQGRQLDDEKHSSADISRLYVVESAMTVTGSNVDHRIRLRPSLMGVLVNIMRQAITGNNRVLVEFAQKHHLQTDLLKGLVKDLVANRGKALMVAGPHLPESVHAAVALLNDELEASNRTLEWNPQPANLPVTNPEEVEAVLEKGIDMVICLGVNPVYDWLGKDFAMLLDKAGLSVGHSVYLDETLSSSTLALPSNHNLESWNDAEPRMGLLSLCQPVIAPLFNTRQEAESLLRWTQALASADDPIHKVEDWYDWLQKAWNERLPTNLAADFDDISDRTWESGLRKGGWYKLSKKTFPELDGDAAQQLARKTSAGGRYELVILPHHSIYDGRFANNGWLQELPDPVSKLVWDNAVSVGSTTAEKLGVVEGEMLTITVSDRTVNLPVLIQPGTADDVLVTTLGYGRIKGGRITKEAQGVNVAPLLGRENSAAPRLAVNAIVQKAGGSHKLVRTQKHFSMYGRPIVLAGTLAEYRREADFVKHKRHLPELVDIYKPYDYSKGHKWAMAVDLGACVGCGACVTACQAENNTPIVGLDACSLGREMHWLRIDRYHQGDPDNPTVHHQPMLCQQCDNAPCENVCPVNATVHSPEGLNEMAYNRCVGTRYCSNNCPYKVRRFNFLRYHKKQLHDPVQELVFNPQVTVRGVGVMEKCTFCVQRINEAKFKTLNQGKRLKDGIIQTACQQTCPAGAIVFGDINNPDSRIARLKASQRAFYVLEELNVKPNVTYQARVRNPNPDVLPGNSDNGSHHG